VSGMISKRSLIKNHSVLNAWYVPNEVHPCAYLTPSSSMLLLYSALLYRWAHQAQKTMKPAQGHTAEGPRHSDLGACLPNQNATLLHL
jgi:hypothetical protein